MVDENIQEEIEQEGSKNLQETGFVREIHDKLPASELESLCQKLEQEKQRAEKAENVAESMGLASQLSLRSNLKKKSSLNEEATKIGEIKSVSWGPL